ncbi:hypothetical protein M6B38_124560 [Iris pallida]|uniref:Uncharacterized protein n=1 Tax=Iris pallida TaxID=29817 RepID=A0AAX6GVI0_IRIPA|nr:hypothetical protein M6B38_124560 [Iris pallida]
MLYTTSQHFLLSMATPSPRTHRKDSTSMNLLSHGNIIYNHIEERICKIHLSTVHSQHTVAGE